uniref:Replication protein A subunit n=1 Tax=Glossina austeni TaxID=7395 RepID=A0A1A9VPT4_GLOAU
MSSQSNQRSSDSQVDVLKKEFAGVRKCFDVCFKRLKTFENILENCTIARDECMEPSTSSFAKRKKSNSSNLITHSQTECVNNQTELITFEDSVTNETISMEASPNLPPLPDINSVTAAVTLLSEGTLPRIMEGEKIEAPVLQVLKAEPMQTASIERIRICISDSLYFSRDVMLATNLNSLYYDQQLTENAIVRVDEYIISESEGKRFFIIEILKVLHPGNEAPKIGEPANLSDPPSQPLALASASPTSNITSTPTSKENNSLSNNSDLSKSSTSPIKTLDLNANPGVIKARVTAKSIRTWESSKSEGKMFTMDLKDESGEIRAAAFQEKFHKFYDKINVDQVYLISKYQLKPPNKIALKNNDLEIKFTDETVIEECRGDVSDVPAIEYKLVLISEVAKMKSGDAVDVVGICKETGELCTVNSKGTKIEKRDLVLIDTSNAAIILTLWKEAAAKFDDRSHPVILLKGARVHELNGVIILKLAYNSNMITNPNIPEADKLRSWFDNGGGKNIKNPVLLVEWRTLREAHNFGMHDKPDYFLTKATVCLIKSQNVIYKACPQEKCSKKVIDANDGQYRCTKCHKVSPNFKYQLLIQMYAHVSLQMNISDCFSNSCVTAFSDVAEQILGDSAESIGNTIETNRAKVEEKFRAVPGNSYIFKISSKVETFKGTKCNKLTVKSAEPVSFKKYNKYLIDYLKELPSNKKI